MGTLSNSVSRLSPAMHSLSLLALALSASSLLDIVMALRLPTTITQQARTLGPSLRRRDLTGSGTLKDALGGAFSSVYSTNITVGGVLSTVVLDTGSSDLWVLVNGTAPQSTDLGGAPIALTYGSGSVAGNLHTATVEIEGASIDNQMLLQVAPENSTVGVKGILGVGPPILSRIFTAHNGSDAARPSLQRLFASNPNGPSFMTTAILSRPADPNESFTGVFTIDEIEPGFEAILNEPQLPLTPGLTLATTQWTVAIAESALIVNGVEVDLGKPAVVSTSPAGSGAAAPALKALLDTGTTLMIIPSAAAQKLYGTVPGASFNSTSGAFSVPCAAELNVSITLGQQSFPIHPLDVVQNLPGEVDTCVGGLTSLPSSAAGAGLPDLILGDTFLRNVMMLNGWGGFVNQTVPADPNALAQPASAFAAADMPFVQLLSMTNATQAHLEFLAARGSSASAGASTTTSAGIAAPTSGTTGAPPACTSANGFAPGDVMQRCQSLCSSLMMLSPAVNPGMAM